MITEVLQYRDLLAMLALRDIRVRYKQAVMGFIWALFMPVVAVMAGVVIKTVMSQMSGDPVNLAAIVSISVKVIPYNFFTSGIKFSVNTLVSNRNLVTKIYFPREVLPLASILACFFDFSIAVGVLIILLCIAKIGISVYLLWLPFLLVLLILFTAGLGLMLSAANLFFRDIKYIVDVILTFGIFFVPVFYSAEDLGKWEPLILINPIANILEAINDVVVLHQMPNLFLLTYTAIAAIIVFILGLIVFEKKQNLFAENI